MFRRLSIGLLASAVAIAPLPALAEYCDNQPTARALIAPWNAADKEFLGGRTSISYFFEMRQRRYQVVYGNARERLFPAPHGKLSSPILFMTKKKPWALS